MTPRCLPFAAALAFALAPPLVSAQASAPPSESAASAGLPTGPVGPRLLTPTESRNRASPPGELRPERPVTPQISIPFGKKPPPPTRPDPRAPHPGNAASASSADDAVARCEAERGEQVRAKCRDRLAHEARSRAPG